MVEQQPQPEPVPATPSVPSLRSERKFSVKEANASNDLLTAIEEGNTDDVRRVVSKLPEGITSALNTPSLLAKHKLRTPLMAAAATGNFAEFTAILNAFDRQYDNKLVRDFEMRLQLANRDRDGMTAAMLGARSGNVSIVAALMTEIEETEALLSLEARDHRHMTLLMHAASVGPSPVFHEVQEALLSSIQDDEAFGRQLLLKSADDRTILMHAASSGDAMLLKTVSDSCRQSVPPHKVREMLVARDSDGLNLLMHAASCQPSGISSLFAIEDEHQETSLEKDGGDESAESGETDEEEDDKVPGDSASATATTPLLFATPPLTPMLGGIASTAANAANAATNAATTAATTAATAASGTVAAASAAAAAAASAASAAVGLGKTKEIEVEMVEKPKVVPVFKIAFKLITECLWKDKILEQLKATDLWGRSVLTHALLSGHKLMFDAALGAVRDLVPDEEVSEMVETHEGEREDEPMITALEQGPTEMRKLFALRVGQLKTDVDARSKLSSIDAKIESFIPGKLVVMFQLLLPQIAIKNQLSLLYVMCVIAPILKLATSPSAKTGSSKGGSITARSGKLSLFLGAPAMFFWGVGTSDVGTTSALGWSPALCATAMAVATICIPAIDAFFYSSSASHWADKIYCSEWRFNFKAYQKWFWTRGGKDNHPRNPIQRRGEPELLPSYATFGHEGAEETKYETTPTTPVSA